MNNDKKESDELVDGDAIDAIHQQMACRPVYEMLNELRGRERALADYVTFCGGRMIDVLSSYGVPPHGVQRCSRDVMMELLVVIESYRQAQYELWRELMGDPTDQPKNRSDNTTNGDNQ